MKKLLLVGAVSLLAVLGACSGEEEEVDGKVEIEEINKKSDEEIEGTVEKDGEEATTVTDEVNKSVVDDEVVSVTLAKVIKKDDAIWGKEILVQFDIVNKSDKSLLITASEVSADGKMIDENAVLVALWQEVAVGKTATATLTLQEYEANGGHMPELSENLELNLDITDNETYETINEYNVNVNF